MVTMNWIISVIRVILVCLDEFLNSIELTKGAALAEPYKLVQIEYGGGYLLVGMYSGKILKYVKR